MKATTTIDEFSSFETSSFAPPEAESRRPEPETGGIGRSFSRFGKEGNVRNSDAAAVYRSETLSEESWSGVEWIPLQRLASGSEELGGMVGRSGLLRGVFSAIERLGPYKATVLIQGESGTGKDLVARALHTLGPCPQGPFVTFNCSNLVDSLAESQLFGHVRGAFTDAREDALGYFRSANGGTLFLDEVAELPLRLQAKLLRSVESYEIQPVGSTRNYHVDIRLVTATNRDLLAMVKAGQFRDDLYYRLNTTAIVIPPLRRRMEDVDVLAAHFIRRYGRLLGKRVEYLSQRALAVLARHDWPGNVREFAHAIESAIMLTGNDRIDVHDLPAQLLESGSSADAPRTAIASMVGANGAFTAAQVAHPPMSIASHSGSSLDEVLRTTVLSTLDETGGNRRRAAHLLGVSRSTLYRMLTRYGVEKKFQPRVILPDQPASLSGRPGNPQIGSVAG